MAKIIVSKEKDFFQISLKIILKNKQGQILGLKGIKGGVYEDYFDLPGGRIDTDEFRKSFGKIIARELKEEIGNVKYELNPRPVSLGWHLTRGKILINHKEREVRVMYICFAARYLSGKIKISDEHEYYQWLSLSSKNLKKYFYSGNLEGLKMYLTR